MKIKLSNAGKRFNREWIFRYANLEFISGSGYAITGHNGSGKSTLLQCLGGMLQLSEGTIEHINDNGLLPPEETYIGTSFCAPYMDVIEEMTLVEFLQFHNKFKAFIDGSTINAIIEQVGLKGAGHKQIRYYSSGMKQRVKLAQAIFFDTPIILLDEPCSNLDTKGIELYLSLIENYCRDRLVVVCSNDPVEYGFCQQVIAITDYKLPSNKVSPKY
jgi:ABC-type multidrug transport system ATPase subunit